MSSVNDQKDTELKNLSYNLLVLNQIQYPEIF